MCWSRIYCPNMEEVVCISSVYSFSTTPPSPPVLWIHVWLFKAYSLHFMAACSIPLASQLSPPPCVLADSSHILLVMAAAGEVRLFPVGGEGQPLLWAVTGRAALSAPLVEGIALSEGESRDR